MWRNWLDTNRDGWQAHDISNSSHKHAAIRKSCDILQISFLYRTTNAAFRKLVPKKLNNFGGQSYVKTRLSTVPILEAANDQSKFDDCKNAGQNRLTTEFNILIAMKAVSWVCVRLKSLLFGASTTAVWTPSYNLHSQKIKFSIIWDYWFLYRQWQY